MTVMVTMISVMTVTVTVMVTVIVRSNADLLKRRAKLFLENAWWVKLMKHLMLS